MSQTQLWKYLVAVFWTIPVGALVALAAVLTIVGWFGFASSWPATQKVLGASTFWLGFLFLGVVIASINALDDKDQEQLARDAQMDKEREAHQPARVRSVVRGMHYYTGQLLFVLDKRPWLKDGQVVMLVLQHEETEQPIALLTIESSTSDGHPQAAMVKALGEPIEATGDYFQGRREQLRVHNGVNIRVLEGGNY